MENIREDFQFYLARNAEHYRTHRSVLTIITPELAALYNFTPLRKEYDDFFLVEDDCYLRNDAWENTQEVAARDNKRDKLFSYISQAITLGTINPDEAVAAAAAHLEFLQKPYKGAAVLNYIQETAAIADFVGKMEEEGNQAYVATLGLTDAVASLKEANQAFEEIYDSRAGERLTRSTSETMKTVRPKVDAAFVRVAQIVNLLYRMNELSAQDAKTREDLGDVIHRVNAVLLELENTLVRAGIIKKPGKTEEEGGDEPTPEPVTPAITAVYSKVPDIHDPSGITRGKETIMKWVGDFELVNETGDGPGKIIVKDNFTGVEEEVPAEDILSRSNTGCEFIMIRDFAEGEYKMSTKSALKRMTVVVRWCWNIRK